MVKPLLKNLTHLSLACFLFFSCDDSQEPVIDKIPVDSSFHEAPIFDESKINPSAKVSYMETYNFCFTDVLGNYTKTILSTKGTRCTDSECLKQYDYSGKYQVDTFFGPPTPGDCKKSTRFEINKAVRVLYDESILEIIGRIDDENEAIGVISYLNEYQYYPYEGEKNYIKTISTGYEYIGYTIDCMKGELYKVHLKVGFDGTITLIAKEKVREEGCKYY
ncbi:MAG: hypothetical protein C4K58_00635 [Flavobacteriaceae bacterium]|nr:MAG: hypothetical protein C4K58_00635 [Flavobacteriaceae bacterium]